MMAALNSAHRHTRTKPLSPGAEVIAWKGKGLLRFGVVDKLTTYFGSECRQTRRRKG
jgi:hypothetical protein